MRKHALQQLADSAAWKEVRSEYIQEQLDRVKDVTVPLEVDIDVSPKDAYLAKVVAAQALQGIIDGIDRFADTLGKNQPKNYD